MEAHSWKNILPPNAPRIYWKEEWISYDKWAQSGRKLPSACRKVVYILFTSQYLNVSSKDDYDLFSIQVLEYDGLIIMKDMHLLKLDVGKDFNLGEALKFIPTNSYLQFKDKKRIYFLGIVNTYQSLVKAILSILKGKSILFPLGEEWLEEYYKIIPHSHHKYRG
jgi:hypothetical protein